LSQYLEMLLPGCLHTYMYRVTERHNRKSCSYKTRIAAEAIKNILVERGNFYCLCCWNLPSSAFWVRVCKRRPL